MTAPFEEPSEIRDRLARSGWVHHPHEGMIRHLGGLWQREEDGVLSIGFISSDIHANRNGVVHGGMLMTLVDRAFGMVSRHHTGAARSATISLSHQFMAPLAIGRFAEIIPRMQKATGRMAFVEGQIESAGELILQAQGVWRILSS